MRSKHEFPQPGSHGTEPPSQGGAQIAFPVFPAHSHSEVTLPKVPDVSDASPIGPSVVSISGYTYSMFDVQLTTDGKKHKVFADTGCSRLSWMEIGLQDTRTSASIRSTLENHQCNLRLLLTTVTNNGETFSVLRLNQELVEESGTVNARDVLHNSWSFDDF